MFEVELCYSTKLGGLTVTMTTAETVATREEAHELRDALRDLPIAGAIVKVKNAKPRPTVDEALDRFRAELRRFPPTK